MPIRWPVQFEPSRAPVRVSNEIEIAAPPGVVWSHLIRAARWPDWYPNARDVKFVGEPAADLSFRRRFQWTTFGVRIESFVEEFVPPERLAWSGRGAGLEIYHAWLITPTSSGCHVRTEETQYGWLAKLGARLFPRRMYEGHQLWLERLKGKCEG